MAFPLREHTHLSEDVIRTLVLLKLQAVGLRGAEKLLPSELSGGMARRAALARAIALDPRLIMYDEPFAGQDPISMGVLVKLIKDLNDALNLTSIVVTHDVTEVLTIADYIYIIAEKQVIGEGTPEQIKNSDSALVQQFLRGEADGPVPFHYPVNDLSTALLCKDWTQHHRWNIQSGTRVCDVLGSNSRSSKTNEIYPTDPKANVCGWCAIIAHYFGIRFVYRHGNGSAGLYGIS